MAISQDLFLAILAMDAYNRGYNEGLVGLGGIGSQIGNATFAVQSDINPNSPDVAASFYAAAYNWNGQTVISYRGTDDLSLSADPLNGWTLGAGFSSASQATLARQFYESVTGQGLFDGIATGTILTGHSLGGGLAGYIASITGTEAEIFDNMPYSGAALAAVLSEDVSK